MSYSPYLLECFYHPQHVGILEGEGVYFVELGKSELGEVLKLSISVKGEIIQEARFLAYGSVALLAGAEHLCRFLIGKTITEAKALTEEGILQALGLPSLKIHTANLLVRAIASAPR